jgi:hypothetical protein
VGTSTTVAQFSAKIATGGTTAVSETVRQGVAESALAGKQIFLANMGTRRLRNVGRGAKVGARFDMGAVSPTEAAALLYYTGPVHIINNPTPPHAIYPRGARVRDSGGAITSRRRKGGGQGLRFPDGEVRLYANHPGTSGKHFFEHSQPQVERARSRIMKRTYNRALTRVF